METITKQSPQGCNNICPTPPPLPGPAMNCRRKGSATKGNSCASTVTRDLWDNLFDRGYRADVTIRTNDGGIIYAHAGVLGMASPVLRGMLKQAKGVGHKRLISIHGVQHDAVRVFIRFLYSSCYEQEEMKELVLPLLVLSHAFVVPQLKRICEQQLENSLLTLDNVVDVFQLSLLCDAPRLVLLTHRMILRNIKAMEKERIRKLNERKIYLQLYEAMEALVHICRDGCRTIGPCDKDLKDDQKPCTYEACKGIELLVRHFAGCKLRAPGGCIHCKRMWQLLELHSRLCADSGSCRVPLCRNFKDKIKKQFKKDEMKWKVLAKKILSTKRIGGEPYFLSSKSISSY
ncbi:hypothetical protein GOBAR_DD12625 [Gossypium barbadense]|nr:hypothetical protein GOBAR_DD12625 [Gossypium barbadense]